MSLSALISVYQKPSKTYLCLLTLIQIYTHVCKIHLLIHTLAEEKNFNLVKRTCLLTHVVIRGRILEYMPFHPVSIHL